jgi:TPR repeat protein
MFVAVERLDGGIRLVMRIRSGPGRSARLRSAEIVNRILVASIALVGGCHGSPSSQEQPAPSASVIQLGMALGTCDDIEVCEKECDAGSADRCRRLAASYALGQGVDKDEARGAALYAHACDLRDASACLFAGQMNEFAHGVAKDDAKAARYYERACDLRWAPGCYNLAIMYERGSGVALDRAKASDLYGVACTAGARQSCEKAKEMHDPPPVPFLEGGLP